MNKILFTIFVIIYYWLLFIVFFILILAVFIATFLFDRYRKAPNYTLSIMGRCMLKASAGWNIKIEGEEKYDPTQPTIFIANHQSFLDMALVYQLPWKMKWVAKKSLTYVPIMGWMVWLTGHLTIDRKSKTALKKLSNLVQPLKDRIPVMIFPEGTRTMDGELKPFKNGAFLLAKQYGFRLQPMVIEGSHKAMPSGFKALNPKMNFHLRVLDAIHTDDFKDAREIRTYAFNIMQEELKKIRSM